MKTKEELSEIKEEVEKLDKKLHELTEEELEQVTGGKEILESGTCDGEGITGIVTADIGDPLEVK